MTKRLLVAAMLLPFLAGCSSFWTGGNQGKIREGTSSSLVDFLYPNGEVPQGLGDRMPQLSLPLRVGIAFVPSNYRSDITAADESRLLEQVAASFRDRPYVESIDAIPGVYMRSARGTQGMQQVAAMFDVDVMALVSYDQISFSAERDSAVLYWTIVGAFVVKGNSNEVQTMIDTAVFDVSSSKLLFRAPGTHHQQGNATFMDTGNALRDLRSDGFSAANEDMIVNLDHELDGFREAVESGERAEVKWRAGSGGGGGSLSLFFLLTLVAARLATSRQSPAAMTM